MVLKQSILRLLPQSDVHDLILSDQVRCPSIPGHYTGLPHCPGDLVCYPDLFGYSLADYPEAEVTDKADGSRVLHVVDGDPEEAYLFGPDFEDCPDLLIRLGLAYPAQIPATKWVGNYRYLPLIEGDSELVVKVLLVAAYTPNDECRRSFDLLLFEVGIDLYSLDEALDVYNIARHYSDRSTAFGTPEALLASHKRFRRMGWSCK
jgi:hypothetical protein